MARSDRHIHVTTLIAGFAATGLVLLAYAAGWLERLENGLYDLRTQRFQYFMPPPTDKVVHVDIDDAALEAVGAWPWARSLMGELVDEMSAAGAKVIALDILYAEPQEKQWKPADSAAGEGKFELVDHDANLAKAFERSENVLVPTSLLFVPAHAQTPAIQRATALLADNLELAPSQLVAVLQREGFKPAEWTDVEAIYFTLRRDAAQMRIERELPRIEREVASRAATMPAARPETSPSTAPATQRGSSADPVAAKHAAIRLALRAALLPTRDPTVNSPEGRLVDESYERVRAAHALLRFGEKSPANAPAFIARDQILPLPVFLDAAASTGYVDYPNFGDGTARTIALQMDYRGARFQHIGLRMACQLLEVNPAELKVTPASITIPAGTMKDGTPRREIVIPVSNVTVTSSVGGQVTVPLEMNIPFFGSRQWWAMYDPQQPDLKKQHVSFATVYDIVRTRQKIQTTIDAADTANHVLLELLDENDPLPSGKRTERFKPATMPSERLNLRLSAYREMLQEIDAILAPDLSVNDPTLRPRDRAAVNSANAVRTAIRELPLLQKQLAQQRSELRQLFNGKGILIGWTAVARVADAMPTPLHPSAPGVVVHGVIVNAILTGELWRALPAWVTVLVGALLGILVTFAVALMAPVRSLVVAVLILLTYVAINCVLLFDYGNVILELGAPMFCITGAWAGGTITRLVIEARERARITRRFATYVDPDIVNYFLEVRDETMFTGQRRETTVVFTDLEGFTRLSNQLREDIVPLLNDFMGRAVRVIKTHRGLVNKFLGDGILFFFNAPKPNSTYISDAMDAILDLQVMMVEFNADLAKQNLPNLRLRAGVTTGRVIAGDAGTAERADYTVIGDLVNLASRLESANKFFGTGNLVTESTAKGAGDRFLFRAVGNIRVLGMETGVMTYETMAWMKDATEQQKTIAELSAKVHEAFQANQPRECVAAVEKLEAAEGKTKLTKVYRELCEPYLNGEEKGPMPKEIVLSEK